MTRGGSDKVSARSAGDEISAKSDKSSAAVSRGDRNKVYANGTRRNGTALKWDTSSSSQLHVSEVNGRHSRPLGWRVYGILIT